MGKNSRVKEARRDLKSILKKMLCPNCTKVVVYYKDNPEFSKQVIGLCTECGKEFPLNSKTGGGMRLLVKTIKKMAEAQGIDGPFLFIPTVDKNGYGTLKS